MTAPTIAPLLGSAKQPQAKSLLRRLGGGRGHGGRVRRHEEVQVLGDEAPQGVAPDGLTDAAVEVLDLLGPKGDVELLLAHLPWNIGVGFAAARLV